MDVELVVVSSVEDEGEAEPGQNDDKAQLLGEQG